MKKAYSLREVVDFIPASLHETKNWEIIFYARDPQSGDLRRKRIRVGGIKNKGERRIWAKQMMYSINKKLNDGWNPFIEAESSRQYYKIEDVITAFLRDKRGLRKDTLRTYQSEIDFLMKFIRENYQPVLMVGAKLQPCTDGSIRCRQNIYCCRPVQRYPNKRLQVLLPDYGADY